MTSLDSQKLSKRTKWMLGCLALCYLAVSIQAYVLGIYWLAPLMFGLSYLTLLIIKRGSRQLQSSLRFEENQSDELRLFVARVLVRYRTALSQSYHESKSQDIDVRVPEAVDKVIERYKLPYGAEARSVIIRACVLNIDYVDFKPIFQAPKYGIILDLMFVLFYLAVFVFEGRSIGTALIMTTIVCLFFYIVRRKFFYPTIWRDMEKRAKDQASPSEGVRQNGQELQQ